MARSLCPSCHKFSGVEIIWGFPSEEDFARADRQECILAGCVMDLSIDHECLRCHHQWHSAKYVLPDAAGKIARSSASSRSGRRRSGRKEVAKKAVGIDATRRQERISPSKKPEKSLTWAPTIIVFLLLLFCLIGVVGGAGCVDGWASGVIGRSGACSHHGGVSRLPGLLAFFASLILAGVFHNWRAKRWARRSKSDSRNK